MKTHRTPEEMLVEWRTKSAPEQRQIIARGLRRIANRLASARAYPIDPYSPLFEKRAPSTPQEVEADRQVAAAAQNDVQFLKSAAAYIVDLYNDTGELTPV